ncbi:MULTISPECIES: phosphatase PAP2 family protein [unclassified Bosea (in: a-proteobacteria)]|uniref:phosphatase PAP2 family protein n=1 Tax=unclassified Bosea (in: a-proteobacteria) TaxID=2653178 RepID=UPI000F7551F0|nr:MULTISPECIES: phosphatase PAP2 family protein [unclassified Bosea (in: a-proteobacteria)]AZO79329.1 hypothetical protein BLM15_18245 [Bosea sp. Tri-49]RXT27258.1 hypothetical protein B5U98_00110 [Bosea sp. Tri-39]RXT36036.1 hypothetical protein B5U99_17890 [Bosea sp. Tri-54]
MAILGNMGNMAAAGNMGNMGNMGNIGGIAGAGAADPALAIGLMVSAQILFGHAADADDPLDLVKVEPAHHLAPGAERNLGRWFPWVRASLYLTDFLRDLDWDATYGSAASPGEVALSYRKREGDAAGAKTFYVVKRPAMAVFAAQLEQLRNYMDQRAERATEILNQVALPPDYLGSIIGLTARNRRTLELMNTALVIAGNVGMIAKHHLACRRPGDIGARVLPMLPTPDHGSFPSGHATEAFAVATVLSGLVRSDAGRKHFPAGDKLVALLHKQAERIAVNRTVAGVHYPIDSWAGAALGVAVGQIILAKCGEPSAGPVRYDYDAKAKSDFLLAHFLDDSKALAEGLTVNRAAFPVDVSPVFRWLWSEVKAEFVPT